MAAFVTVIIPIVGENKWYLIEKNPYRRNSLPIDENFPNGLKPIGKIKYSDGEHFHWFWVHIILCG